MTKAKRICAYRNRAEQLRLFASSSLYRYEKLILRAIAASYDRLADDVGGARSSSGSARLSRTVSRSLDELPTGHPASSRGLSRTTPKRSPGLELGPVGR